jgi:uncharacterized protein (TIGR02996 family)
MATIEDLMRNVASAPDDDNVWLVLADALDDAGRTEEAELIRNHDICPMLRDGVVIDSDLRTYHYQEDSGHSEEIDAEDMGGAVEEAEEICRNGSWGEEGAIVSVWVIEEDADGNETDRRRIEVEIEPDHDALISRAGGDPDCDHDWTREGEGGCHQNPGVWSLGGTKLKIASHCRCCGLHRIEIHCGSQRNPGEHDTVEYSQPSNWCADCQEEECECE